MSVNIDQNEIEFGTSIHEYSTPRSTVRAEANNAIKMYWSGNAPGYATLYGIAHA